MNSRFYSLLKWLLPSFFVLILITSACDNTIDPFEEGAGIYSIYGYLAIDENPNYIRISDLNEPLVSDPDSELDAVVTLENVETGERETLADTVVQFEDVYTHNFRTELEITPETKYQLTVERSDGEISESSATTPEIPEVSIGPTGEDCMSYITVVFEGVTDSMLLRASVGFDYSSDRKWARPVTRRNQEGYLALIFTPQQILDLYFQPAVTGQKVYCHQLDTDQFYLKYDRMGPDWYGTEGEIDTIDVMGGTGRFGGIYRDEKSFTIDDSEIMP